MSFDWKKLFSTGYEGQRDGQAGSLEALALGGTALAGAAELAPAVAPAAVPMVGYGTARREILIATLSSKLLGAHLDNRFQISYPLVLNFENLDDRQSALLMEVAADARLADGSADGGDTARLRDRLQHAHGGPREWQALETALANPRANSRILTEVAGADLGAHAYAIALLALKRRSDAARLHLAYMAARLGLGQDVVGSLTRRFRF